MGFRIFYPALQTFNMNMLLEFTYASYNSPRGDEDVQKCAKRRTGWVYHAGSFPDFDNWLEAFVLQQIT